MHEFHRKQINNEEERRGRNTRKLRGFRRSAFTIYSRNSSKSTTKLPFYFEWAAETTIGNYEYEMWSELKWTSTTKMDNLSEFRQKSSKFPA